MTTLPESIETEQAGRTRRPSIFRRAVAGLRGMALGKNGWKGATIALAAAAAVALIVLLSGFLLGRATHFFTLGVLLVLMALMAALANLIGTVILPLLARLLGVTPKGFLWALVTAIGFGIMALFGWGDPSGLLVVLAWAVGAALVGAGLGAWVGKKPNALSGLQRAGAVLSTLLGAVLLVGVVFFLLYPGPSQAMPPVSRSDSSQVAALDLPDPSQPGAYAVTQLTYGSGTDRRRPEFGSAVDVVSHAVDGSALIDGWDGLTKVGRDLYWGFDKTTLPLNGRVWMPQGEGPFPLVLIVHGNHLGEDFSDGGYDYLGELLASRGYIFVSVDENFLNSLSSNSIWTPVQGLTGGEGLKGENDARGWLLLEHLRQWREWAGQANHPLGSKVDLDRIALIGHSRGGEAVAVAAAFNRLPAYPDNALTRFDYGFNIRSVVAIAPVDGQYWPSQVGTVLEDVSYFTIQGSHDADMRSFEGSTQWQRVHFTQPGPWFKSYVYIYGANHGQFNRSWGSDYSGLAGRMLNRRNLIPAETQQQVAKVYLSAFLDATLKDEDGYQPLFEHWAAGQNWLPEGEYINRYADADQRILAGYEEDVDVQTGSLPGVRLDGSNLTQWSEQRIRLKWDSLETKAALVGWEQKDDKPAAIYALTFEDEALVENISGLSVSLADARGQQDAQQPIDLTVEVIDADGDLARLLLSSRSLLPPQMAGEVTKLTAVNPTATREVVFQSYDFALADFQAANPAFDPQALAAIRLVFDQTAKGSVFIDEFRLR
jgi:dienelactone hydrolase